MNKNYLPLLLCLGLFGCAPSEGGIGVDRTLSGVVTPPPGEAIPEADLAVVWNVTATSPDYAFVAGGGSFSSSGFDLTVPDVLPDEAKNQLGSGRLGVGAILAFTPGAAFPNGRLSDTNSDMECENGMSTAEPQVLLGAAPRYAVIYREGELEADLSWANAFPEGYSCGRGVDVADGFDIFEPVDCDTVEVIVGDLCDGGLYDFVDWT